MKFPDKIVYRLHAVRRMFERDISEEAVKSILQTDLVIQEYVDDQPYPSCLIAGDYQNRPLHVVVSVDNIDKTTIVITAYVPDLIEWEQGYMVRRKK